MYFIILGKKCMPSSRFAVISILIVVSTAAFSQKYQGDSWAKVKSSGSGTLTVVYAEQFGLIHKDKDGKIKGVCVDILSDFAKYIKDRHGKILIVKYADEIPVFAEFLSTTQNTPNILGVTNTTITEERKKILKFSPPLMLNSRGRLTNTKAPLVPPLKELPTNFRVFTAKVIVGSPHLSYAEKTKTDSMHALKL